MKIFTVDAFTHKPFAGNPAAVCLLPSAANEKWMQSIAREMNLSETAFLFPEKKRFNLRWFTPTTEVDLCGHATLASAHILWEQGVVPLAESISFSSQRGTLTASKNETTIELDFPAITESEVPCPPLLVAAIGLTPKYVGQTNGIGLVVELASESLVKGLVPDLEALRLLGCAVTVTSRDETSEFDFISRFFAPSEGLDEDPVTGSAHCFLAPYWKKHLYKDSFVAYQASSRGGVVHARVQGDRVILGGQAVTVLRGELSSALSANFA